VGAVNGIFGAATWSSGSVQEMELDLSALPNSDGSTTNLLAVLRTEHSLDILVQANTAVIICNVARTSLRALLTQVGSR